MIMEKSSVLKDTINEVLNKDIPSKEEISHMSRNEKIELEKQQQKIIDLFREKITQQLIFYQDKIKFLMNEIVILDQIESDVNLYQKSNQPNAMKPRPVNTDKASDMKVKERITEIKMELSKLQALSTYKRRKAWR